MISGLTLEGCGKLCLLADFSSFTEVGHIRLSTSTNNMNLQFVDTWATSDDARSTYDIQCRNSQSTITAVRQCLPTSLNHSSIPASLGPNLGCLRSCLQGRGEGQATTLEGNGPTLIFPSNIKMKNLCTFNILHTCFAVLNPHLPDIVRDHWHWCRLRAL